MISLKTKDLLAAVKAASDIAERSAPMAILACARIIAESETMSVTGTDLAQQIITIIPCAADEPFSGCVNAARLSAVLQHLQTEDLQLRPHDNELTLVADRHKINFQIMDEKDYPTIETSTEPAHLDLDGAALQAILKPVVFAAAIDDVRYYLNGVNIESDGHRIITIATNGHQLAKASFECQAPEFSLILPLATIKQMMRMPPVAWSLAISRSTITISADNIAYIAKAIDGKYPDWRRFFQNQDHRPITLTAKATLATLEPLLAAAEPKKEKNAATAIVIELANDSITYDVYDTGRLIASSITSIETGRKLKITVNGNYLADAMRHAPSDHVDIFINDSVSPIYFACTAHDWESVLMPMRV